RKKLRYLSGFEALLSRCRRTLVLRRKRLSKILLGNDGNEKLGEFFFGKPLRQTARHFVERKPFRQNPCEVLSRNSRCHDASVLFARQSATQRFEQLLRRNARGSTRDFRNHVGRGSFDRIRELLRSEGLKHGLA